MLAGKEFFVYLFVPVPMPKYRVWNRGGSSYNYILYLDNDFNIVDIDTQSERKDKSIFIW